MGFVRTSPPALSGESRNPGALNFLAPLKFCIEFWPFWIPTFVGNVGLIDCTRASGAGAIYFFTYILASQRNGTLYTGSTDDLRKRVWEHKNKALPGFTSKYGVDRLVWFETHDTREGALTRERRIKEWKRAWKIEMIERENPDWADLYDGL